MNKHLSIWIIPILLIRYSMLTSAQEVCTLANNGKVLYSIVSSVGASEVEQFAAHELKRFLSEMSQAEFDVSPVPHQPSIVVSSISSLTNSQRKLINQDLSKEAYSIFKKDDSIFLIGGSPRSTLYAVYDFLNQLGCRWVAPDFTYYEGTNNHIPTNITLKINTSSEKYENPAFSYRKLYVEEGRSHTLENLKQLIDWMPKSRLNTLVFPLDYEGKGNVKWDKWRVDLIPELKKRGIQLEVGGHGYQNFINASMEDGTLYERHPEWFGLDDSCIRSKNPHMVICTSNKDAVNYMYGNVLDYLKGHPEIEIIDFWPPDSELWCRCEKCLALGGETERHVLLVNQIAELLEKDMPEVQLECLAYNRYTTPTQKLVLNNKVLLDFCPINQSFDYQIYENGNGQNEAYIKDLNAWLKVFKGDVSIYSYFRKYAWRSLPNIIPHYMQNELKYYQELGVQGISVYSEPGDWFTFGVNHYVFSHLVWNPATSVDSLTAIYSNVVYGKAASMVVSVYDELEDIVRFGCNIRHSAEKTTHDYDDYLKRINVCRDSVAEALNQATSASHVQNNLKKLDLMLAYAAKSISYMRSKSLNNNDEMLQLDTTIKAFLKEHAQEGVFIPHKQ